MLKEKQRVSVNTHLTTFSANRNLCRLHGRLYGLEIIFSRLFFQRKTLKVYEVTEGTNPISKEVGS